MSDIAQLESTRQQWDLESRDCLASAGKNNEALGGTRVLHVINGEHYSGAERVQDLLADRLADEGFNVGFACVKPDVFPTARKSQQAPLYLTPMRSRFDWKATHQIARIIREDGYALVHAHTPRTLLVGGLAALLTRVPMVYHVHSPTAHDSTRRVQNWLNTVGERIGLSSAAKLITVSESLATHMRSQGFRDNRLRVVPNGVPTVTTRGPRGPDENRWTLGSVALFRPRKGIEVLLGAISILKRWGCDVELLAVGGFETEAYEIELKARVNALQIADQVKWTGFVGNVHEQLMSMDLFVLPSLFGEGLPMVVLEAMSAGVPVVSTRVEGIPEAIRDGIDGVIANPGDAEDMANAIVRVIYGPFSWKKLQEAATQRHAERFSDVAMASGVAAVYREVLGNKKARAKEVRRPSPASAGNCSESEP